VLLFIVAEKCSSVKLYHCFVVRHNAAFSRYVKHKLMDTRHAEPYVFHWFYCSAYNCSNQNAHVVLVIWRARDVVLGTCTCTRTCHLELQVLIQVQCTGIECSSRESVKSL